MLSCDKCADISSGLACVNAVVPVWGCLCDSHECVGRFVDVSLY